MEVILALVGVIIGSGTTLAAQLGVRRREERERWLATVLDACAAIYKIEDAFISIIDLAGGPPFLLEERAARWPRDERAQAGARLRLVTDNDDLQNLETELRISGKALWNYAQRDDATLNDLQEGLDEHRAMLERFVEAARPILRQGSLRV